MYAWSYTCTSIIYIHVVVFPIKCQSFWDNQTYPIGAASRTKLAKQNIHPQLSANPKPSLMSHHGDPVISTENPSGKVKKISKASSSWKKIWDVPGDDWHPPSIFCGSIANNPSFLCGDSYPTPDSFLKAILRPTSGFSMWPSRWRWLLRSLFRWANALLGFKKCDFFSEFLDEFLNHTKNWL